MIFLSYDYRDFDSVKSALRTYQELRLYFNEYKQHGTILKLLLGKSFTAILGMSTNSAQIYQYADQIYSGNPNLLPNNLALLFMLGQNDLYSGKFFGKTTDKLFARIDAKKSTSNGYIEYPSWITGVIPNPSVSTTPDELMVVNLLAKELSDYEKVFNDTLLSDNTKSFKTVLSMVKDFGITLPLSKSNGNDPINKYQRVHDYLKNVPVTILNVKDMFGNTNQEAVLFSALKIDLKKETVSIPNESLYKVANTRLPNGQTYAMKYFIVTPKIHITNIHPSYDYPVSSYSLKDTAIAQMNIVKTKYLSSIDQYNSGNTNYFGIKGGLKTQIVETISAMMNKPVYVMNVAGDNNLYLGIGYADESLPNKESYPLLQVIINIPYDSATFEMFSLEKFLTGKASKTIYSYDYCSEFVADYFSLNKSASLAYFKAIQAVTPQAISEFIFNDYEIFSSQKEKEIFNVFLNGDISLDYLKNVVIPDKILKVEKDVDTQTFPLFLKKLTTFNPFIFDDNYLLVDIESIRPALLKVSNFIENSLFAQDIHTLNKLADQVSRSIGINNDAIAMLSSEQLKLQKLDEDFQKTLASAKQLQIVYDMLKNQSINAVDPVVQSQIELDNAIKSEMSALEAQYAEKARLLSIQKENELKAQQTALYNAQQAEEARIAEEKRLQEEAIRKAELEKQTLVNQATSEAQTQKELTEWHNGTQATDKSQPESSSSDKGSSSALPLIAVASVLALVSLGGSNE